ncbi:hypothetical protein RIR_jg34979.t1 [Rhizophagus irregularis DAOM 181602=DAOM 197198]|nr:hypothetical protein RIR_jg34979.t1 [Rhizophagus irregularis DAOM 181602=DAOM 197198]CAB5190918.1 unnamed protein product [Rhizophagus irregularis]
MHIRLSQSPPLISIRLIRHNKKAVDDNLGNWALLVSILARTVLDNDSGIDVDEIAISVCGNDSEIDVPDDTKHQYLIVI